MNAIIFGSFRRSAILLWLGLSSLALLHSACSSSEASECDTDADCSADEHCSDNRCRADGCAAACSEGEHCVGDRCRPSCVSKNDCAPSEVCAVWRFDDGTEASVCSTLTGRFSACSDSDECDRAAGFSCVAGVCRSPCRSHDECAGVGHCAVIAGSTFCEPGTPTLKGRHGTRCPSGARDCDAEAGFLCLGAGPGDLDSYCTADCTADSDCPAGFRCGSTKTVPCERACGLAGDPDSPDCAPADQIGDGLRYQCGTLGVIRRVCERRDFCSPCERDEDCLGVPGQICARDESGARICTVPCTPGADSCPWGNAGQCGNYDAERGITTCSHRFGSCRGSGKGCEPCIQDSDCGDGLCSVFGFSGERYCIDLTATCDCAGEADRNGICLGHGCPETPGGLEMVCLESRGAGDPFGERCISASSTSGALGASQQAGCWPPL